MHFLFKMCLIFHFPVLCRYVYTSCYTSISLSRCCQSQMIFITSIFSCGPWQGIEKRKKNCYEQSCLNHVRWQTLLLVVLLCSQLMLWRQNKPYFSGVCFTFPQEVCLSYFALPNALMPSCFSYTFSASRSAGSHGMYTGKQGNH